MLCAACQSFHVPSHLSKMLQGQTWNGQHRCWWLEDLIQWHHASLLMGIWISFVWLKLLGHLTNLLIFPLCCVAWSVCRLITADFLQQTALSCLKSADKNRYSRSNTFTFSRHFYPKAYRYVSECACFPFFLRERTHPGRKCKLHTERPSVLLVLEPRTFFLCGSANHCPNKQISCWCWCSCVAGCWR